MKESYNKGVANHVGPKSCLDDPRGSGEALTGGNAGGLLSSEITRSRKPTLYSEGEGNSGGRDKTRAASQSGGVLEPGMCGHPIRGNRETSEVSSLTRQTRETENIPEKAEGHTAGMTTEESDNNIVPKKQVNNGVKSIDGVCGGKGVDEEERREGSRRPPTVAEQYVVQTSTRASESKGGKGTTIQQPVQPPNPRTTGRELFPA